MVGRRALKSTPSVDFARGDAGTDASTFWCAAWTFWSRGWWWRQRVTVAFAKWKYAKFWRRPDHPRSLSRRL